MERGGRVEGLAEAQGWRRIGLGWPICPACIEKYRLHLSPTSLNDTRPLLSGQKCCGYPVGSCAAETP